MALAPAVDRVDRVLHLKRQAGTLRVVARQLESLMKMKEVLEQDQEMGVETLVDTLPLMQKPIDMLETLADEIDALYDSERKEFQRTLQFTRFVQDANPDLLKNLLGDFELREACERRAGDQ